MNIFAALKYKIWGVVIAGVAAGGTMFDVSRAPILSSLAFTFPIDFGSTTDTRESYSGLVCGGDMCVVRQLNRRAIDTFNTGRHGADIGCQPDCLNLKTL